MESLQLELLGWVTINLATPFAYNGTSNLVIAVDENNDDYDEYGDDFHNSLTGSVRSIYANSDVVNINPEMPYLSQDDFVNINTSAYVPNIILNGISQACPNVSAVSINTISTTGATVNWVPGAGQTNFEIIVQLASLETPTDATSGTLVNGVNLATFTDLSPNSLYNVYIRTICGAELKSAWENKGNFTTLCPPVGDFYEQFTTTAFGAVPNCWNRLISSQDSYAYVRTNNSNGVENSKCAAL